MGIKRIYKIRNEEIRARAGVANTSKKMREAILLDHVERKTRGRCRNENSEHGSKWTPKDRKTKIEVE